MADLIDMGDDDVPTERRLRLSIRWRSIATLSMFPQEARACIGVGFFLGDEPLFNDSVYWRPKSPDIDPLPPGYFKAYDDNCGLLTGLNGLLYSSKRLDFEDLVEPLFRLIIAPDAFDPSYEATSDTDYFDVLAVMYWGGNWHGQALGESGPVGQVAGNTRPPYPVLLRLAHRSA